jgi:hypothetical protein
MSKEDVTHIEHQQRVVALARDDPVDGRVYFDQPLSGLHVHKRIAGGNAKHF